MTNPSTSEVLPRQVVSVIHSATFGGPHNQAVHLAQELRRYDCRLSVVVPNEPGDAALRLRSAGIDVTEMHLVRPRRRFKANVAFVRGYPHQITELASYLRDVQADIVEVHGLLNFDAALAAKLVGAALVWQLIDTRPPMLLRRFLMPAVVRTADVVMTTGQSVATAYPGCLQLGPRLVSFVPPVRERDAPSPAERRALRSRFQAGDNDILIVTIGNLNPQKGHDLLLRVASQIRTVRPHVRVAIRGATQPGHEAYAARIAREAQLPPDGTITVGPLEPEVSPRDLMHAADIFALPSRNRSEGLPTVVLEAMAERTPVVVSQVGSVTEIVTPSSGVVIPSEDEDALFRALLRLIDDPVSRRRLADAAAVAAAGAAAPRVFGKRHWEAYTLAMRLAPPRSRPPNRRSE